MNYRKLKDVQQFTVKRFVKKYFFKWDEANKKGLRSDTWLSGYKPVYEVEIEDAILSLSQDQLGQMLVATFQNGEANILNRTFTAKTNGKSGMEIRYFLNLLNPNATKPVEDETELPF